MESQLTAFRCPADLMQVIDTEAAETGKPRSAVIIERLKQAFGLSEGETLPPSQVEVMQEAIAALQSEVMSIKKRLDSGETVAPLPPAETAPVELPLTSEDGGLGAITPEPIETAHTGDSDGDEIPTRAAAVDVAISNGWDVSDVGKPGQTLYDKIKVKLSKGERAIFYGVEGMRDETAHGKKGKMRYFRVN